MSGALFVSDPGSIQSPGVYAVEVQPPILIEGIPNGKMGYVGQFNWGPVNAVYEPLDTADFLMTYAPPGSSRTSSGYQGLMKHKGLSLAVVRVLKGSPVKASVSVAGTGGNVAATAKYEGTAGNALYLVIESSSDGVSGSKKFSATWTDSVTGTYSEVIADNVAAPNGTPVTFDVSSSRLLSAFSIDTATSALPANSSNVFSSGANGTTITHTEYSAGMDALDVLDDVAVLLTDDCGDSIRTAVNGDVYTHAVAAAGRYLGVAQGASGSSWATIKTDKVSYASKWMRYSAGWVNVIDDGGTTRVVPWSTWFASAIINLPPEQSDAWWKESVTDYYTGISSIYTTQFSAGQTQVAKDAMALGITIPIKLPGGRIANLHDRNASLTVADRYTVTSRIRRFLALSLTEGLSEFTNAPNVAEEQTALVTAVKNFMDGQVSAGRVTAYSLDATTVNTAITVAQGFFYVAISATTPAPMERIGLLIKAGPTVTVTT